MGNMVTQFFTLLPHSKDSNLTAVGHFSCVNVGFLQVPFSSHSPKTRRIGGLDTLYHPGATWIYSPVCTLRLAHCVLK